MRAADREVLALVRARGAVPVPSAVAPVEVAQRLLILRVVSLVRVPEGGLALVPYVPPPRARFTPESETSEGEAPDREPRRRGPRRPPRRCKDPAVAQHLADLIAERSADF